MNLTASRRAFSLALGIDEKQMVKTLADAKFDGKVVEDGDAPDEEARPEPAPDHAPLTRRMPGSTSPPLLSSPVMTGVENASIHRMQVLDDHRVAARLVEGRHTHVMLKRALAKGEKLPDCGDHRDAPGRDLCELHAGADGDGAPVCRGTHGGNAEGEAVQKRCPCPRRGDRAGRIHHRGPYRGRAVCRHHRDL